MNQNILERLFPNALPTRPEIEARYPSRGLSPEQLVTRIAPSPTGFMHIGTLYTALVAERLAHQSGGVFFLRLEDTDKKREVEGADLLIVESLKQYGIIPDEKPAIGGPEVGAYGPYIQSRRREIYQAYVKHLLENGQAYPCFATPEEMETMRKTQESLKLRPGYYGEWAKWRNASDEQIVAELDRGTPFVIRFRSNGDYQNRKVKFQDLVKGRIEMPENDQDIVILKSDGLPTYHLAHVVDDHLMGTTHVTRGDEWLASVPLHLQLFQAMGWAAPVYAHLAPIQKTEGGSRRKLSKRKDPEASMSYYGEQGYPQEAVIDYLLNLANSNFEDWRRENPGKSHTEFIVSFEKLGSSSGALFDFVKLGNISKEIISRYTAARVYAESLEWAQKFDPALAALLEKQSDYAQKILNIERENAQKPRKDIAKWSDLRAEIASFFDENFSLDRAAALEQLPGLDADEIRAIIADFLQIYDEATPKDVWFEQIKTITRNHGFADDMKAFRANPAEFRGSIVDVTKIFRVLLTGRGNTPDLYELMHVMGRDRVARRLSLLSA
jgi:glutamyl-tRNA synthetase